MIRKLTAIAMAINAVSRPIGMLPIGVPQHRIASAATGGDAEDVDTDGPSRRKSLIFRRCGRSAAGPGRAGAAYSYGDGRAGRAGFWRAARQCAERQAE